MSITFTSAVGSHVGMVRSNNQDSAYAGNRLFLVADGMGGHAGGDVASALTARAIARLDEQPVVDAAGEGNTSAASTTDSAANPPTANLEVVNPNSEPAQNTGGVAAQLSSGNAVAQTPIPAGSSPAQTATKLADALLQANRMLRATVGERPELAGLGTTFCGFYTVGNQLALAHIGDSRLYLLRDGKLKQITKDHTFVQRLVDSGRITEDEAKTHPRRSVLMRVLGDVEVSPDIDTEVLDTQPGDLWLLCSDGLCGYVDEDDIEKILLRRTSLQNGVNNLIERSLSFGAPDNVTVVLVETAADGAVASDPGTPRFAGSALTETTQEPASSRITVRRRALRQAKPVAETQFEPRVDEYLKELIAETKRRNRRRRLLWALGLLAVAAVLVGGTALAYEWTQTRYFVGTDGDTVLIYRGVQQNIAGFSLSSVIENTGIPLSELGGLEQRQIERTLSAGSLDEAHEIVQRLGVSSGE